jgi:HD domain
MARADDIVTTDAERACLAALRAATGESDGAMERHCVRQFLIAERLGEQERPGAASVDRELLLCAALVHDAGLYPGVATADVYVTDSRRLAERTIAPTSSTSRAAWSRSACRAHGCVSSAASREAASIACCSGQVGRMARNRPRTLARIFSPRSAPTA